MFCDSAEFADPMAYLESKKAEGEKYGKHIVIDCWMPPPDLPSPLALVLCAGVILLEPPPEWDPPFYMPGYRQLRLKTQNPQRKELGRGMPRSCSLTAAR